MTPKAGTSTLPILGRVWGIPAAALAAGLRKGAALYEAGDYEGARLEFSAELRKRPASRPARCFRAMAGFYLKRFDQSLQDGVRGSSGAAGDHQFEFALAELKLACGDEAGAALDLERGTRRWPTGIGCVWGWTMFPLGVRSEEEADRYLARVSRRHPRWAWGLVWRARRLRDRGILPEAIRAMDRALDMDPDNGLFLAFRGRIRGEWRPDPRCAEDLTRALETERKTGWVRAWRGEAHRKLGKLDIARSDLDAALRLDPKYALAWAWRGRVKDQMDDPGAASDFNRAIRLDPGYAKTYAWRAGYWMKREKLALAAKDLDRAIQLNPNCGWFYEWRARCHVPPSVSPLRHSAA